MKTPFGLLPLAFLLLGSLSLAADILPYGFMQTDSKRVPKNLTATVDKVKAAVGLLELKAKRDVDDIKKGTVLSAGTGYVIEPGDVVATAAHVTELWELNRDKVELIFTIDGQEPILIEKLLSSDSEKDRAQLQLPQSRKSFLKVSKERTTPGNRVLSAGYPWGNPKLRLVFSDVSETTKNTLLLSGPSLPGMSGGPVIQFDENGGIVGVVGLVSGMRAMQRLPELEGAFTMDYGSLNDLNNWLKKLLAVDEPEKVFKISEGKDGERRSEILSNAIKSAGPVVVAGLWNFRLGRNADNVTKTKARFTEMATLLETEAKTLDGLKKWSINSRAKLVRAYRPVITLGKVALAAPLRFPAPLCNVPVWSEAEFQALVQKSESPADLAQKLRSQAKALVQVGAQLDANIAADMAKVERYENEAKLVSLLLKVKENPELRFSDEFLNKSYFYLPTLVQAEVPAP